MLKTIARQAIASFGRRYDYDVGYMLHMLDVSPGAMVKFRAITQLAQRRERVSKEAFYAAKLVGAMAEDCGPCVQLVIDMASEADVKPSQIEAVLVRNVKAMTAETALGYRFATAIVGGSPDEDDARDAVREKWGDKGVLDLTFALQIGRLFPMVKAGLGFAKECRQVHIGDRPVDVAKQSV